MQVKIILEKGESPEEAKELLLKALQDSEEVPQADPEEFADPVMQTASEDIKALYTVIQRDMWDEINELLERET